MTRNIKLILQYDGSGYSGWQVQNKAHPRRFGANLNAGAGGARKKIITIQGVIEDAIEKVTGTHSRITGAGRTDAGVHAFYQVAAFRTKSQLKPAVLMRALNANLPDDVRIIRAQEKPADFHPRYGAKHKTYSYLISQPGESAVFFKRYSWQMPYDLNITQMRRAAGLLIGKHDFACFRASGCGSKHAVRTIKKLTISKSDPFGFMGFQLNAPLIKISVQADAFLRYMVRNIVGTLVEVGKGKLTPDGVKKVLRSKDRRLSGPTAPANGLFLEKIIY